MTPAALLAGLSAALATAGLADLAHAITQRRGTGRRRAAVALLARAGRRLGARAPGSLADRVAAAGVRVPAADVMAAKAAGAVAGLAVAAAAMPVAPGRLSSVLLLSAPAGGFLLPDAWLRRRTLGRRRTMEAELAGVLDLLRVAVAAGLSPKRALHEVGRRHPGVLAAELRRAATAAALGTPTETALGDLERRCPAAGVPGLVAALRRAERHGAPLAPALAAQAQQARARETQRTLEAAARAAPQIQLVVALLLVPAVMLLVAAALIPAVGSGIA
jgi:tight adherence protein C